MKIQFENRIVNLPDVLMVGAAKSGTTTLYHHLSQHPGVFFPKDKKEPFYFSSGGKAPGYTDTAFVEKLTWQTKDYLNLYQNADDGQILMDGSTSYLYCAEESIGHIKELYGDRASEVKIIVILRNPIERAYSHYTYLVRNGVEDLSFEQALEPDVIERRRTKRWGFDYLEYGRYTAQVKAYQENFDSVKVCLFEDLKDAQRLADGLFEFLGLATIRVNTERKSNPSGIPTSKGAVKLLLRNKALKKVVNWLPASAKKNLLHSRDKVLAKFLKREQMSAEMRTRLQNIFRSEVQELSQLIQRDLQHWQRS